MKATKVLAVVLIAAGVLALVYGGFNYTKKTSEGHLGPLELTMKDQKRVNIPAWAGVAAVVIGAGLLLVPARKA